jgi:hypothetical protein
LIQPGVRQEVQKAIKERKQAHHSAVPDNVIPLRELTNRRNAQREQKKSKRPRTGGFGDVLNWIGAEIVCECGRKQPDDRRQAQKKHNGLGNPARSKHD